MSWTALVLRHQDNKGKWDSDREDQDQDINPKDLDETKTVKILSWGKQDSVMRLPIIGYYMLKTSWASSISRAYSAEMQKYLFSGSIK